MRKKWQVNRFQNDKLVQVSEKQRDRLLPVCRWPVKEKHVKEVCIDTLVVKNTKSLFSRPLQGLEQ